MNKKATRKKYMRREIKNKNKKQKSKENPNQKTLRGKRDLPFFLYLYVCMFV